MANQWFRDSRRARTAFLVGAAAVGLSGALVVGHAADPAAMVRLASAVVTIGGQGDPTSGRVQDKLGRTVIPPGYDYFPIQYPASIELDKSRDAALRILHTYLTVTGAAEPYLIVAGYSLGTMAAEQEKRNLQALDDDEAPSRDQLSFVMIASPFAGNGGIFPRFAGISIPFITAGMGAAQPSRYDTTYSAVMYDTYADFPAYFNPIALLNSVLSIRYGHPDAYYDPLDPTSSPRYVTAGPDNLAGGKDTYVLYYNPHLPLFGPLRELASVLGLSAFTEPLISAIEPLARIMVDMAYTDRVNANPATATPFSLITPPEKFFEALAAIPGALAQGLGNLATGGHAPINLPDPIGNLHQGPVAPAEGLGARAQSTPEDESPGDDLETGGALRMTAREGAAPAESVATAPPAAPPSPAPSPEPTDPPAQSNPDAQDDGLHPRVTADGNRFTPGTTETSPSATPGTTAPTTTGSTTTGPTTAGPTTTVTTTGPDPGAGDAPDGQAAA